MRLPKKTDKICYILMALWRRLWLLLLVLLLVCMLKCAPGAHIEFSCSSSCHEYIGYAGENSFGRRTFNFFFHSGQNGIIMCSSHCMSSI